jgi:hypothetical protein
MSDAILIYVGTGIVAIPNESGSGTIGVYPQELLADANGNVVDATDINGLTQADIITAAYRNTGAYSDLPPLLAEGDVVTLLEHADTNVVYWQPFQRSLIRKVTKLAYSFPAKPESNLNDDQDNNYRLKLDTEEGILSLVTTKARDESVAYNISLSTLAGMFTFQVDNGDVLQWDNESRKLTLLTNDIHIEVKKVYIKGETTIDGNVFITKSLKVKGSMASGGNISAKGSVAANKSMRARLGRFPNLD